MPTWDPDIYNRYQTYRDRPALDLLLRLPDDLEPREVWDLGCGTGEHAALLALKYPDARVHGLDSSAEMLAKARGRSAAVDWVLADIDEFAPETAPDLIFTSSTLQWLPDHQTLFPRLAAALAPGGAFACQIPVGFETRHHQVIRETAGEGPWAATVGAVRFMHPSPRLEDYYAWLAPLAADTDIWLTTYLHVLEGTNPVIEWIKGTALRPYLDALTDPALREAFMAKLTADMAAAFPPEPGGETLFPFPRMFVMMRRRG